MDTPILILLLLLLNKNSDSQNVDFIHNVKNYVRGIEVDYRYTGEKIKIVKKIRPYLPAEYIDTVNKSILVTEKLVKLLEVKEFMEIIEMEEVRPVEMEPKDKLLKVVNLIQEDVKNSKIENLGFALDLIGNIDNYKNMLNIFTSIMRDKKSLNDPATLMKLASTFLGDNPKEQEKLKELTKMMDILKLIDTPKKEIPSEN